MEEHNAVASFLGYAKKILTRQIPVSSFFCLWLIPVLPDVGVSLRMTQFVAPFGILKNVVTARKIQTRSTHKLTLKSARRNNS